MKAKLFLIACVISGLAFEDGRDQKTEKIRAAQIGFLQGEEFSRVGITGKGIRIAILDGGFPGTNTHPGLKHLVENNQIVATWNFVRNSQDVYTGVSHGTAVLACIAGKTGDGPLGLAPDAEFLLALTEQRGEPLKEELNWAKAVDWAIENGADIIQSSLGYTYHRYFADELDGRHSIAAQAAARAARKGILVINCNGNEGQSKWQTLVTPADADSILGVGAVDPGTGLAAGFSSVGPTADYRLKPNVCAPGKVITLNPKGGTRIMEGTSFSSPLVAGFAACTWQKNRSLSGQEILALIEKSGHLYPYYDYSHGYGIPQASRILNPKWDAPENSITLARAGDELTVEISGKSYERPSVLPGHYLYYQVANPSGHLVRYGVYRLSGRGSVRILVPDLKAGDVFRCHFNGETATWEKSEY